MLADLSLATEDRTVPTRFGDTHVLVTGPEGATPVVLFHGGNSLNPLTLEWFAPLAEGFRIYAPDTVGQPGKSAQTRPSAKDESFGLWATDVLDGLGLERAALVGPSHGAGIALKTATVAPERVSKMVLLVPSGIVGVPTRTMAGLGIPYLLYRLYPRRGVVALSVRPLCGGELDEKMLTATEAVFGHVRIEPSMPRPVGREDLAGFHAPTLVVAAEKDVLFPGRKVIARAREVFQGPLATELLEDCPHRVSPDYLPRVNERIAGFLGQKPTERAPEAGAP
jgi:pimeloyl-ACP methyl ester carboxylesterase